VAFAARRRSALAAHVYAPPVSAREASGVPKRSSVISTLYRTLPRVMFRTLFRSLPAPDAVRSPSQRDGTTMQDGCKNRNHMLEAFSSAPALNAQAYNPFGVW
ncbi:MAG: hypothetical protein KIT00_01395, partial [Rhodospirillales bacterium]|nr:hypothetical protein [Rhodospirillales bacterium]